MDHSRFSLLRDALRPTDRTALVVGDAVVFEVLRETHPSLELWLLSDWVGGAQFVGHCLPADGPRLDRDGMQTFCRTRFAGRLVETKLLIGMCISLRRETLRRVGVLDESMFLGSEDLELSWRLRVLGFRLAIAKDVFVHHRGHVSFGTVKPAKAEQLLF